MKKVLVVTGTRSEYGLLYWIMKEIDSDEALELQLIVTGNHLSSTYGNTVEIIKNDGFTINEEIEMLIDSNKKSGVAKSMGLELIQMAQAFDRLHPDILLVLGDRYETFIAVTCAMVMNIPIAHMNGGESTEGAIDEQIRHSITKMAHIHFAGAEYYRDRIIKMGEDPRLVYNVGQAGIENIKRVKFLSRDELEAELHIKLNKKTFLITYHPVTLDMGSIETQMDNLLRAIVRFDAQFIFTYPNADFGSKIIIEKINEFGKTHDNTYLFDSLGQVRYLSLMKYADVMIGNSSSGIIESPIFKLPVINIGDRQKGRLRNNNIIDTNYSEEGIYRAIDMSINDAAFRENLKHMKNLYGDGTTSKKIVNILKTNITDDSILMKKLNY